MKVYQLLKDTWENKRDRMENWNVKSYENDKRKAIHSKAFLTEALAGNIANGADIL